MATRTLPPPKVPSLKQAAILCVYISPDVYIPQAPSSLGTFPALHLPLGPACVLPLAGQLVVIICAIYYLLEFSHTPCHLAAIYSYGLR